MNIIEVNNLKKNYGNKTALNGIDFSIDKGIIYGLLGPNGSGKSTIINILSGLLGFNSGSCKIFNLDINKSKDYIQQRIGVVSQEYSIYDDLTAKENIEFFGRLYGLKGNYINDMVRESLKLVDLWSERNAFPESFSGGMKRRLNIACSLVHNPEILIMDEPTASLDPISRDYILETVKLLNKRGSTIIYTSHYLEEVDLLCNEATILNKGNVIAQGTTKEIKNIFSDRNKIVIILGKIYDNFIDDINRLFYYREKIKLANSEVKKEMCVRDYNKIEIECSNPTNILEKLLPYLRQKEIMVNDIQIYKLSLEEAFLKLIKNNNKVG